MISRHASFSASDSIGRGNSNLSASPAPEPRRWSLTRLAAALLVLPTMAGARNILNGIAGPATRDEVWSVSALEQPVPSIILEPLGIESRPAEVHEFERTSLIRRLR